MLILYSCKRDYAEEIRKKVTEYEQQGKKILAQSIANHFIIFKNNDSLFFDNLNDPPRNLFPNTPKFKNYDVGFDNKGTPIIEGKTIYMPPLYIGGNFANELKLMKGDSAFLISYNNRVNNYDYFYSLAKSDTIFVLDTTEISSDSSLIFTYLYGDLANNQFFSSYNFTTNEIEEHVKKWGLPITWLVGINDKGEIVEKEKFLLYRSLKGDEISINISDLTEKIKYLSVITEIENRLTREMREFVVEQMKEQFENMTTEAYIVANEAKFSTLKFENRFQNRNFLLKGIIKNIARSRVKGYKYCFNLETPKKHISYSEVRCFSNDDKILELDEEDWVYVFGVFFQCYNQYDISIDNDFKDCLVFKNLDELVQFYFDNPNSPFIRKDVAGLRL